MVIPVAARMFDIGQAGQNFQEGWDQSERKSQIQRIGAMASRGDLQGASSAMMQIGTPEALQAGLQMRDQAKLEAQEKKTTKTRGAAAEAFARGLEDGEIDEADYNAIASIYAQGGDIENAMAAQQQAVTMQQETETKAVQGVVDGLTIALNSGDQTEAAAFMDQIKNDELVRMTLDEPENAQIKRLLYDEDPANDVRAMAMWAANQGADTTDLMAYHEAERDQQRELELEAAKAATDRLGPGGGGRLHRSLVGMPDAMLNAAYKNDNEIRDNAQQRLDRVSNLSNLTNRFMSLAYEIAGENEDWSWSGSGPGAVAARYLKPTEMSELKGISERIIAGIREAGTGTFTDADAARAEKSVVSVNMDKDGMERAVRNMRLLMDRHTAQTEFYQAYFDSDAGGHGSMNEARNLWNSYKYDVPIFVEYDDGSIRENPNAMSIYEWMASGGQGGVSAPAATSAGGGGGQNMSGSSTEELNAMLGSL